MFRRLCMAVGLITSMVAPAFAAVPRTFAISEVPASTAAGSFRDAGVDVTGARFVRISASGTIATRYGACGHFYTPDGCGGLQGALMAAFATAGGRPISGWFAVGTFANLNVPYGAQRVLLRINGVSGREFGTYHVVADAVASATVSALGSGSSAAAMAASSGPQHQGPANQAASQQGAAMQGGPQLQGAQVAARQGATQVASVGGQGLGRQGRLVVATSSSTPAPGGRGPGSGPTIPTAGAWTRSDVQYMMRRLGFSDSPEQVSYWYTHGGPAAWLANQLNYTGISDAQLPAFVYAMPTLTGNTSQFPDSAYNQIVENRLFEQQVATQRQLVEKLTLHWLEHFSISEFGVNSPGAMDHYIETVRADALGNFAKLVSDVSKEPAMLYWLDNNGNNGNSPTNPPNQNFGRELMQLYTIGLTQLNMDGTPVLDGSGNPVPTYQQADVVTASEAMTGFIVHPPSTLTGAWPSYMESVQFSPATHYNPANNGGAPLPQIFGQTIADPGGTQCVWIGTAPPGQSASGSCVLDNLVTILAAQPTTCAYEAKEMIQRIVNENPSPAYVKRIATVWCANLAAPNQIALVVNAIATDPEFSLGKYSMVKEPLEFEIDAIRALRGPDNPVSANPITGTAIPLSGPVNDSGIQSNAPGNMEQRTWYPPTVFSFYYPGQKEGLVNNIELLYRWTTAAHLGSDAYVAQPTTQQDTSLDMTTLAPAGTVATAAEVNRAVNYILDALVDGGTPELRTLLTNYMMNYRSTTSGNLFKNGLRGAIWMVLTSPEYEAN